MNGMEIHPTERRRTDTALLPLDIDNRLELLHGLRALSSELQETPFIKPAQSVTELKGILLRPDGANTPALNMAMKVYESDTEPSSATVAFASPNTKEGEGFTYIYRPSFNIWEEWHPGASEYRRLLENKFFVSLLETHLPEDALRPIMDKPTNGMEVAHLLADFLQNKARSRTQSLHYKAHGIEVGGKEYVRDTDFVVTTVNKRIARSLFVAASFNLDDYGHVRKAYRFDTVDSQKYLDKVGGSVVVSAGTQVPITRLRAFGLRDPIRNDAIQAFKVGVNDIRSAHPPVHLS